MLNVKRKNFLAILVSVGLVAVFEYSGNAHPDERAKITVIAAQTSDSITFEISSVHKPFQPGEDIFIAYRVENKGKEEVYLVLRSQPSLAQVGGARLLKIEAPVQYPNQHSDYDYELIKILPKQAYRGKFVIGGNRIPSSKEFESEVWEIQASFSYLFNPSEILIGKKMVCKNMQYPLPCLTELYKKAKTLTVGNLVIEVKNQ